MTGVVIRDAGIDSSARRLWFETGNELVDVADARRESHRFLAIREVAREELAVAFHRGATAGGVDDDCVARQLLEAVDQRTREAFGFFFTAGVERERAAATLTHGDVDLATFGGKDAQRCRVHVREKDALHATGDESDVHALVALRVDVRGEFLARRRRRSEIRKLRKPRRQEIQNSRTSNERLQSASNIQLQRDAKNREARRIRENRKHEVAKELVEKRTLRLRFDLRTRRFDQQIVTNARWTSGDAGHAAETAIEVRAYGLGKRNRVFLDAFHQVDPSARRIHLDAPRTVRRAGR